MTRSLLFNALAFLLLYVWFVRLRYRVAVARQQEELAEPPATEADVAHGA